MIEPDLQRRFRQALRGMASTVCLLAVRNGQGALEGLAVTTAVSLSFEPLSMLACVNRNASAYGAISAAPGFGLSILGAGQHALARAFATRDGRADRFREEEWDVAAGAPTLRAAPAAIICRRSGQFAFGAHDILVGEVVHARSAPSASPLAYWNGDYASVAAIAPQGVPA